MPAKKTIPQALEANTQSLLESESLFRAFVQQNVDGIALIDPQGIVVEWNASMESLTGFKPGDMIGLKAWDMQFRLNNEEPAPDRLDFIEGIYANILQTGSIPPAYQPVETTLVTKDGRRIFIEQKLFTIRTSKGNWLGVIMRDLTERRRAENEIQRLSTIQSDLFTISAQITSQLDVRALLQSIVGQARTAIEAYQCSVMLIDAQGYCHTWVGEGYSYALEAHPVRPNGTSMEVVHSRQPVFISDMTLTPESHPRMRQEGVRASACLPLLSKAGTFGVMWVNFFEPHPFAESEKSVLQIFANQVAIAITQSNLISALQTSNLELEQRASERENLIAELRAKNAELERFTYTVSHDLKSPLVTIKGFLGYLEQHVKTGNVKRFQEDAQRIANAVDKMSKLLSDLLELSRIGRMMNPAQTVTFDDVAREALNLVQGRLEERGVAVQIQPNLPKVRGDHQRLIEVLQNLIDNAAKYMGDQPQPKIEIGQRGEEDGKPICFVKDNGMGIAREHHERIFGLFNKLDSTSEGTGVGLTLVKRIIEFHGGRIWVESEAGKGSAFYFTLPRG